MFVRHLLSVVLSIASSSFIFAQDQPTASVYARSSGTIATPPSAVIVSPGKQNFPSFAANAKQDDAAAEPQEAGVNQLAIPAVTVTSSLAVVLGLFAAMVWLTRKYGSRSIAPGAIPREVLESLGTTAIDARTRITMLRCGGKILVLAQTPTEVRAISEITDPEEVRHLTATCLGNSKREFAVALKSLETEAVSPGFTADPPFDSDSETPRQRGRLFATA
jgi:flagellar biogenesis protein FliO